MKVQFKPPNLDFLKQSGPAGYVAGSLRNDKGFTLRPDMGPIDLPVGSKLEEQGLFTSTSKTAEDEEADAIYASIEDRLKRKLKKQRLVCNEDSNNVGVFGDLKPELERVSVEEWASLPEATDFRIKKLKRLGNYQDPKAKDRFIPLPDNLLSVGSIGYDLQAEGFQEEEVDNEEEDKLLRAGEAREAALGLALDSLEKSLGKNQNQTSNSGDNASNGVGVISGVCGDVDKARSVLKNLLRTNPKVPSAWLAAARLEHSQGKLKLARHLLSQGCEQCPEDADLWIEAIRFAADKPKMLENALESEASRLHVVLWIECLRYQKTVAARLKLIQTGLEVLPKSPRLWQEYIVLVDDKEERENVLEAAIQCAPQFDFFLELAQLLLNDDLERAMALCNEACRLSKLPTEQFRLQLLINEIKERLGQELDPLCALDIEASTWLIQAEKRGSLKTVNCVKCDNKLLSDFVQAEAWECAKAVLRTDFKLFKECKLPLKLFQYLTTTNRGAEIDLTVIYDAWYQQDPSIMDEAFKNGIASEEMWLQYLRDKPYDCNLFEQAHSAHPQSARITLLQAQMINNPQEALEFVKNALCTHTSAELWLLYARLSGESEVYKQAVEKCPESAGLWISYAQTMPSVHRARATLDIARRKLSFSLEELLKLLTFCVEFERKNGNELGLKALEQQLVLLKSKLQQ